MQGLQKRANERWQKRFMRYALRRKQCFILIVIELLVLSLLIAVCVVLSSQVSKRVVSTKQIGSLLSMQCNLVLEKFHQLATKTISLLSLRTKWRSNSSKVMKYPLRPQMANVFEQNGTSALAWAKVLAQLFFFQQDWGPRKRFPRRLTGPKESDWNLWSYKPRKRWHKYENLICNTNLQLLADTH